MDEESKKLTLTNKVILSDGKKCKLVQLSNIRYFESSGNYAKVYFNEGNILIYRSLNQLVLRLSDEYFFQANRRHIINLTHIKDIQLLKSAIYAVELTCGKKVEISRRRSQRFRELLSL